MGTFAMCLVEADINTYQAEIDHAEEREAAVEQQCEELYDEWLESGLDNDLLSSADLMQLAVESPEFTEKLHEFLTAKTLEPRKDAAYEMASVIEEIIAQEIYDAADGEIE